MSTWTETDLAAIDGDGELNVAAYRPDGTLRTPRIIWHVVVDGALYVRSVRGRDGAWYRGVLRTGTGQIDAAGVRADVTFTATDGLDAPIDAAYRSKYGSGSAVQAITSDVARAATVRVDPR